MSGGRGRLGGSYRPRTRPGEWGTGAFRGGPRTRPGEWGAGAFRGVLQDPELALVSGGRGRLGVSYWTRNSPW